MIKTFCRAAGLGLLVCTGLVLAERIGLPTAFAQDPPESSQSTSAAPDASGNTAVAASQKTGTGIRLGDPVVENWQFGLLVVAEGQLTGIETYLPLPTEWPEQKLRVLDIQKSDQVTRSGYKEVGENARIMQIKMNQIAAGDTAKVVVKMEVTRHPILEPEDTNLFRIPKRVSRKLRQYLNASPYIEVRDRKVRQFAADAPVDEDAPAWDQVKTIYEYVREKIKYEFDREIKTCVEALENGQGDCEEMTSLFIAICRNRNIPARAVWVPDHTYPEFYLEDDEGNGHWFPCQVAGDYAFGSMPDTRPIVQKGDKYRLPGHKKQLRYIQPTLTARDARAKPHLRWLMNRTRESGGALERLK